METKDWKSIERARILLIGHDPRLQKSDTIANYVLFANYYFHPVPNKASEKRKYGLAKSTFEHIDYITNGRFKPKSVYITNLCNSALEHAPKDKTVLIPKDKAEIGLENIKRILKDNSTIEYVFPMSLQVNYWLQNLNFYNSYNDFLKLSEPSKKGVINNPPYFQPKTNKTFLLICGKRYNIKNGSQIVIPILHTKNYPLKGRFLEIYGESYDDIKKYFKNE